MNEIAWGSLADWLSAVATTFAALVSLFIARAASKRKAMIKTSFITLLPSSNYAPKKEYIEAVVINKGNVSIFLNSASIQVFEKRWIWKDKFIKKIIPNFELEEIPDIHKYGKNIELVPGDSYIIQYPYTPIEKQYTKMLAEGKRYKFKFTFTDTLGHLYYSKDIKREIRNTKDDEKIK